MRDSRFIQLLRHVPKTEHKWILPFAHSETVRSSTLKLLEYCFHFGPKFTSPKLRKEVAQKAIGSGDVKDAMKEGLRVLERYIVAKQHRFSDHDPLSARVEAPDEVEGLLRLCEIYERLGLDVHRRHVIARLDQLLKPMGKESADRHYYAFRRALSDTHAARPDQRRREDPSLQKAIQSLDLFYISTRLKLSCELLNRQPILNHLPEDHAISIVEPLLRKPYASQSSILQLYASLHAALSNREDTARYEKFRQMLLESDSSLTVMETHSLFALAINYCLQKVNAGQGDYRREILSLYRAMDERNIMKPEGYTPPWHFRNMVEGALRLQEWDAAKRLAKKYAPALPDDYRFLADHIDMVYHFRRGDYEQAERYFRKLDRQHGSRGMDDHFKLSQKKYEAMTYLILRNADDKISDLLANSILAYKQFLRRKKLFTDDIKKSCWCFIRVIEALQREKKTDLPSVLSEVRDAPSILEREWLLEYISDRMKKSPPDGWRAQE